MNYSVADIALSLPIDTVFSYAIPKEMASSIAVGKRVRVPFGTRSIVGYVVGLGEREGGRQLKELKGIIDAAPIVSPELLALSKLVASNFFCTWGEAIAATVPGGLKGGKTSMKPREEETRPPALASIGAGGREMPVETVASSGPHTLTDEQKTALDRIVSAIEREESKVFLLHGVTASGKTEVYLQAIEKVLKKGKGAIVLVPEISLTPQTEERFVSRFGKRVAVIHSRLTAGRRFVEWKRILDGEADIVVGARSAIFSPIRKLGLIVVDEEHETSYKQEDVPRYHAREVAEMRAGLSNCPLVLGTATPSLESYYKAKQGAYVLLDLTRRIDNKIMPKVKIVDMRLELATKKRIEIFSKVLIDAIERTLKEGKQGILFLNRRGYSTFVNCKQCGLVLKCRRCDSTLVYHFHDKALSCHYCSFKTKPPEVCPSCRSKHISYLGLGTEKVESEMVRRFPFIHTIARMDSDTTSKRGSHDRILKKFRSGEVSLLVGTQMIAKGLDFPNVTLVAVISADSMMNLPDFRASERTFNLLTQVAGRSGRGDRPGEVIVQTYAPSHYAVLCAAKHDYKKFYEKEIESRKELQFPPFAHLIKVTVRSRADSIASSAAEKLAEAIRKNAPDGIKISGPAPSPIARLRGYYRWNILVKSVDRAEACDVLKRSLKSFKKPSKVLIAVDVDPMSV
ncbi:MAG: primosomal protein N' [Candidatus Omnitrophota bacterium]